MRPGTIATLSLLLALGAGPAALGQEEAAWREAESGVLINHVQLTTADRFSKAGEAYLNAAGTRVIFQAVETTPEGEPASPYYAMFVADVVNDDNGRVTGLTNYRRLSPEGSANTCGWFHPTKPNTVIFGSTIVEPSQPDVAGYQRGTGRYAWQFPKEMSVVACDYEKGDGTAETLDVLIPDADAYLAECSLTRDGRNLLFCRYVEKEAPSGGDLFVLDVETGKEITLIDAEGYDGGPFFSPDEAKICYRSDRRGDNLLQLFVSDLARDASGAITGVTMEHQITNNRHVNWAPYWHPRGRYLIYTTSEQGHRNYEVYLIDTEPDDPSLGFEATKRRITHAPRFDGIPVFNTDASKMMWTSQRGEDGSSQLWIADFVLDLPFERETASP